MKKGIRALSLGVAALFAPLVAAHSAEPPKRVVSMNVCTDQLAMMIAHPGQLHSVSFIATDPGLSVMAEEARAYTLNRAQAEEIFLMKPDLIVTGQFASPTTVAMLRRLGFRIEQFPLASSLEDIKANVTRMGELLGNRARADALNARFDAELKALKARPDHGHTVALYQSNSYTTGTDTMAEAIIDAAGLTHMGSSLGQGIVRFPLEQLVMESPDMVVAASINPKAPARAQEIFAHPAYQALLADGRGVVFGSAYLTCGTPLTLQAATILADHAEALARND